MHLYYTYFGIILLIAFTGLIRLKKLNKSSKIILLLLGFTIISETVATSIGNIPGSSNLFVYHLFLPIEVSLMGWCYHQEIREKWILIVSGGLMLFCFINSFFIQHYTEEFCSYTFILNCISSTIFSIRYLKLMLDEEKNANFMSYSLFWISIGFTTFNIINLFILGTHNVIASKIPNIGAIFRNVRFFSNYLLYILIGIAFLSKQETLSKSKR